ncbi:hypothetical protein RD792_004380 [Penstemon davidsonii]|uniref:Uncharacterized protein n=1 Tax=Penstemon davidsonii TaxID=160366 RepID=A0ABR0DH86_9LAMI|nr:hypothetical protein RD792_004380 [Penstemon davidsonii]
MAYSSLQNAWWLDIGRLSTGFGVGLLSYVVQINVFLHFTPFPLSISGTIPCLIQLVGLFLIPESPRWLAKTGHWDGSEASLVRLRGKNANIFEEATEIRVGVGLMVLQQFGGVNAIAYYASAIFASAGN